MTGRVCFVDTETTSLRPDRRAWEIAVIERVPVTVRHPDGPDTYETEDREHHWFVRLGDLDLGNADLMSLRIGRFHERHPQMAVTAGKPAQPEAEVQREVEEFTRGAHLVGAVVSFDADVLDKWMRACGICRLALTFPEQYEALVGLAFEHASSLDLDRLGEGAA